MPAISKKTKGKTRIKAATAAATRPQLLLTGTKERLKATRPLLERGARLGEDQLDRASRALGEALAVYAPRAAYDLGLAEPPKPKRTAPCVAVGAVIGASAMYFLEPGHGNKHRKKVARLAVLLVSMLLQLVRALLGRGVAVRAASPACSPRWARLSRRHRRT